MSHHGKNHGIKIRTISAVKYEVICRLSGNISTVYTAHTHTKMMVYKLISMTFNHSMKGNIYPVSFRPSSKHLN